MTSNDDEIKSTKLPCLIAPSSCSNSFDFKNAFLRWIQNFKQNPSEHRFLQSVSVYHEFKCRELSHEERVYQSKSYASLNRCSYWNWTTPFGVFRITFIKLEPDAKISATLNNRHNSFDNSENFHTKNIPNIILLHGFTASKYSWRYMAPYLCQIGFRVWVLDLLGCGSSDAPLNVSYEPQLFIKQIDDFMNFHHISKAHFMGHSLGGGLSALMAIKHRTQESLFDAVCPLLYAICLSSWYCNIKLLSHIVPLIGSKWGSRILEDAARRQSEFAFWTEFDIINLHLIYSYAVKYFFYFVYFILHNFN